MQVKPEKDMRKLGCNSGCSDTHNAACGGNNFTSVYRILPHNDSRHIPEKQEYSKSCLIVHINSETNITRVYEWKWCSVNIWVFCTSDSDQSVTVHQEKNIWRDAATLCFRTHGYPTGYKDVRNVTYVGIYGWTGVVRSDVIYKDTDLEYSKNSLDISYGYLKYDSSVGYVLNFSKEDTRNYILCNAMTTERLSSTHLTNKPNTSVSLADEVRKSHNDSSTKDTDIPVIVGVSVSATLAVVIMVIILILVQRKKILCCTEGKQLTEVADQKTSKTKNPISHVNNSYELVDAEYIDTAIKTTSDLCDDTYNMPEQEADEVNTNETTYDIAGTDRQTFKQEHDNIYNKLQSESSPIYDHTNDKSKTGIQASDHTYNTTNDISVNSGFKLGGNHAVGMNTIEESPYNHTNSDLFERKQVDNVYNTASFQ
ncbi:uncharacterized protein LOC132752592 isoform X2 [Ruditapes philippinarum]|uniref:uncharacterized protein LOC132752592 isoform X2 n=1 Tax=Ruditapes philippinarum TaxID=129788 RepID=UPI00295B70ED|nr:uncharacterized protein LOC132752592 isoform X2 [Ruditapes philippinarum]